MTHDYVLDLRELAEVFLTKRELEKLMTDRYKKLLMYKIKASAKIDQFHKKFKYFPAQP